MYILLGANRLDRIVHNDRGEGVDQYVTGAEDAHAKINVVGKERILDGTAEQLVQRVDLPTLQLTLALKSDQTGKRRS